MKKPHGRPPSEGDKRTKLVAFYLTPNDHHTLKNIAEKGGFKSTSSLLTALIEPVIQGRLALRSALSAITRVQRFMESNGAKFGVKAADVKEGILNLIWSPPPPVIPDAVEDISQLKKDLRALLAELENQTEPNNTK